MKLAIIVFALASTAAANVLYEVVNENSGITANVGTAVVIGCNYFMHGATNDSRPYIYWYKGRTIDDPAAVQIFYGYEGYDTNDDVKLFYNGYDGGKADVLDITSPDLTLYDLNEADEGRYWCMVTDFTQSSQMAMDADSTALSITTEKPYNVVQMDENLAITITQSATLTCTVYGTYDMITWFEGPFHDGVHSANFVGTYKRIGSYTYHGANAGEKIEPEYAGKVSITSSGALHIDSADVDSEGRYWCRGMHMMGVDSELETDQSSVVLEVSGDSFNCTGLDDGLYANEYECSVFWSCVDGDAFLFHCYPGLYFNPVTQTCDYPYNVCGDCSTNPNAQPCP